MQTHFLQVIDPNKIIDVASGVRPDNGSAYGYLILVFTFIIAALIWLVKFLLKKNDEAQEKREKSLEKAYEIMSSQGKQFEDFEDSLNSIKSKQDTHSAYLQQIISKS